MTKLLLVEDDSSLGATLQERLEKDGYQVVWAKTQSEAEKAVKDERLDLAIVDIGLPDGSGLDFARYLKLCTKIPFIFVTAMNSADYRLEAFEIGAEEYIPKPFHLKEFLLRVRRVLEKHKLPRLLNLGGCTLDLERRSLIYADGKMEAVPTRDFDLLVLLVEAYPRVVSRDEIMEKVWSGERLNTQRTIDNAIVRLRQQLGGSGKESIRSVRGVGYQWTGPVATSAAE